MTTELSLMCETCGDEWPAISPAHHREVMTAARTNKAGPFCGCCLHLEMARRYAEHKGLTLSQAVTKWENALGMRDPMF